MVNSILSYLRRLFGLKHGERCPALAFMVVILFFQYLIISKFWCLFADYSPASFRQFIRNFHMSGFDPITYDVVTQWHQGYDILRHPLLAVGLWPLHLLNRVLWMLTDCNCVQFLVGAVLTFCAFWSCIFLHRTMTTAVGIRAGYATLLTFLFLGFAYILLSMIVPDHFCLSMFCLTLTLYMAGRRLKEGRRFTVKETILLFLLAAGVTLTNGAVVLFMVLAVNGKQFFNRPFFIKAVVMPLFVILGAVGLQTAFSDMKDGKDSSLVAQQMKWTDKATPKMQILQENFFGESLQLHRKHILGDVLRNRPVIVRYSYTVQDWVVILIELLLVLGLAAGYKERFTLVLLGILGFNLLLHIVMAFAIKEVYIMTAHWAFVIPPAIARLFLLKDRRTTWFLVLLILPLTLYLHIWHGMLLYRYLTWPLVK